MVLFFYLAAVYYFELLVFVALFSATWFLFSNNKVRMNLKFSIGVIILLAVNSRSIPTDPTLLLPFFIIFFYQMNLIPTFFLFLFNIGYYQILYSQVALRPDPYSILALLVLELIPIE